VPDLQSYANRPRRRSAGWSQRHKAHAKATDEYIYWRKLAGVYDLEEQQIQLQKNSAPC
jgi:hypothetical protein